LKLDAWAGGASEGKGGGGIQEAAAAMATESPVRMLSAGGMRGGGGIGGVASLGGESLRGGGTPVVGSGAHHHHHHHSSSSSSSSSSSPPQDGAAELGLLLNRRTRLELSEKGGLPQRSGSAPPSVEGSFAAMGGLFSHLATNPKSQGGGSRGVSKAATQSSAAAGGAEGGGDVLDAEQEQRSDPAYLVYYYNNINLNPRLPPPIISWENYRLAQRLQSGMGGVVGGGIGDKRKLRSMDDSTSNSRSLFSTQPVLPTHREEPEHVEEDNNNSSSPIGNLVRQSSSTTNTNSWADRRVDRLMMGLSSTGIGARPKSLVDLIQVVRVHVHLLSPAAFFLLQFSSFKFPSAISHPYLLSLLSTLQSCSMGFQHMS